MPKILYISLTGMTETLGESQVLEYLLDLVKKNKIHLFSFEKKTSGQEYDRIKNKLNLAGISWYSVSYSNRFGMLTSFWQILVSLFILSKIIKKEKIDLIHARSIIPALIGVILKRFFSVKLIFDIRGFAIDEKIQEGRLNDKALITKFLKKIEAKIYKSSDHVVTLTHTSKPIINKNYNINLEAITVIPTCANKNLFRFISPAEKIFLKKALGFEKDSFIIIRNGSINASYDIDSEIKVFKELENLVPNIKFVFLNINQHPQIQSYIEKYGLKKESYQILSVGFNKVCDYLNISDLCIFFVNPTFAKQASLPTKFAETVACKLYSVTNTKYGDMEYYFNSYRVGILLELEEVKMNPKKAAQQIIEFIESNENSANGTNEFDKLFNEHFSKQVGSERYQLIYDQLVNK